eukprot:15239143-Ditylum_brightwellii.AAC.1
MADWQIQCRYREVVLVKSCIKKIITTAQEKATNAKDPVSRHDNCLFMTRDVVSNEEGVIIASLWTRSRRGRFTSARSHEPVRQGSLMLHTMLRATLNSHYHNGHKAHATTLPLEADR